MVKIFKRLGLLLGVIVSLIFILLAILILSARFYHAPEAKDYGTYWPRDMTYETADSISMSLVTQMTLTEKLDQMSGDASWLKE